MDNDHMLFSCSLKVAGTVHPKIKKLASNEKETITSTTESNEDLTCERKFLTKEQLLLY